MTTRYQIVTLRVPFTPDAPWQQVLGTKSGEDPPSEWNWTSLVDAAGPVTVLDCDPVSEDPDVQPIERLPDDPLANVAAPDDDRGDLDEYEYDVTVDNRFLAVDAEDAVRQMVAWLCDSAATAGYRVGLAGSAHTDFIDAEDII